MSDARVRAVTEALRPYAWRGLTPDMVSRLALAAINGHGAADGAPVTRRDVRIGVLVDVLAGCRWRSLTAGAVSRQLVTALDTWRHESQWLEIELRWLLDGDG
ncbi:MULTISPECIES: hypothetical protein [unclassified Streptomyces]|uniref:hypothetical protein n=1 Tax=unclassified Streptomyces TaxID=2593676 RepID=UPI0023669419|nr:MULTISPECIES: hypothetical protein [unclassified Streptomyces]MDF3141721.1 hypothetical protein [Streptomyces sp. T21Q-yed]WDF38909.1 hypothetical protein PBV52_19935 [Streptomyces sp. T12]